MVHVRELSENQAKRLQRIVRRGPRLLAIDIASVRS